MAYIAFVKLATGGLHGPVKGYQVVTHGLVYEGGAIPTASEIPTLHLAEGLFSEKGEGDGQSETTITSSRAEGSQPSLAGKFIVRK